MNLGLFDELEAVLDGAQESVRNRQSGRVLGRHVAGVGHLRQAGQRRPKAESRIPAPVHQLQQLHRELHIPDPAATPFELTVVEAPLGDDRLRSGLHRSQLCEVVGSESPRPKVLRGRHFEQPAGVRVASAVARLQQGLELPGPGPPVPVRDVGVDRAHEHAGASLGTEIGVDAERPDAIVTTARAKRGIDLAGIGGDEEDVDVARVVELIGPVLAHGDDGKAVVGPGKAMAPAITRSATSESELVTSSRSLQPVEVAAATSSSERCLRRTRSSASSALAGSQRSAATPVIGRGPACSAQHLQGGRVGDDHAGQRGTGCRGDAANLAARAGSDSIAPRACGEGS